MNRASAKRAGSGRSLAFIGDTLHHLDEHGRLYTHGALAAQLDLWASRFDQVIFCGVRGAGPPPPSFAPYASRNIELVELRPAGGSGWRGKADAVAAAASWARTVVPVLRRTDAVHLRTPCNITLVLIPFARVLTRRRYAIFAGSWQRYRGEPVSYRLQRWMLRHVFGGVVHAYVTDESGSGPLRPAFSPVLTDEELTEVAARRDIRASAGLPGINRPLRLVSVGRFSTNKNQATIIDALRAVAAEGIPAEALFIGDGPLLESVQRAACDVDGVQFVPVAGRQEVFDAMAWADLNVLASFREGYPKVLLEGISAGALPVAADRPVNRSMVDTRGWTFDPARPGTLVDALRAAVRADEDEWSQRRSRCLSYARSHTLDAFRFEVDHIVGHIWGFTD